jgi:hypothetical protein
MKTTLLQRLPMIPRLTGLAGKAEHLANNYIGWELLEVDDASEEILICKPCSAAWTYTRSQHLLILCGETAAVWRRNSQHRRYLRWPTYTGYSVLMTPDRAAAGVMDQRDAGVQVNAESFKTRRSAWLRKEL